MDVKLNFINESTDANVDILIFQKNAAGNALPVAWKVIQSLGQGAGHPVAVPVEMQVAASNAFGNSTPMENATPGRSFRMMSSLSGDSLVQAGTANSAGAFEVTNGLPQGVIDVSVYKGGRLLAVQSGLAPGQTAPFQFKPTIWVGVVSQIQEGDVLDSAIISGTNTQIPLEGIASADVLVTGGGSGMNATPYTCTLANVVKG